MRARRPAAASPADLYGPLLAAVQERGILPDGKTFVDAVARRPAADIMVDFASLHGGDRELLRFVHANFDLPATVAPTLAAGAAVPLRAHIRAMWPLLARDPRAGQSNSSALPVGHRHVVPGGRFREIYYWDSFFTMLGLVRDGEHALAGGMVDAMTDLIEEHGHVPNGTRTYYLGRSQPPVFHMMVALLGERRPEIANRRIAAMRREYRWWMEGVETVRPGTQAQRVAMLADGSILNRYWDPRGTPRDESWREDIETALGSGRPAADVYRDLRAGAESGWDFSSRWFGGDGLSSIRTTLIAPVDLNAFLYGLERALAACGGHDAPAYADAARRRRDAMHRHLWYGPGGYYADHDLAAEEPRPALTAAAFAPLLAGSASRAQADATAQAAEAALIAPGGLRTTLIESGEQWDRPNGWAPLQWIAVSGLRRYGHHRLADIIAQRWIATVDTAYGRTGLLFEKYDVETGAVGGGGEYAPQVGFGWTNGVTADLIDAMAGRA